MKIIAAAFGAASLLALASSGSNAQEVPGTTARPSHGQHRGHNRGFRMRPRLLPESLRCVPATIRRRLRIRVRSALRLWIRVRPRLLWRRLPSVWLLAGRDVETGGITPPALVSTLARRIGRRRERTRWSSKPRNHNGQQSASANCHSVPAS